MILFIISIRYLHIYNTCQKQENLDKYQRKFKISYYLAITSIMGLLILSNFTEKSQFIVHLIGVFLFFIPGYMSQIIENTYSYHIFKKRTLYFIRWPITTVGFSSIITCLVTAQLNWNLYCKGCKLDPINISVESIFHNVSVLTEWIAILCMILYNATFSIEIRDILLELNTIPTHEERQLRTI